MKKKLFTNYLLDNFFLKFYIYTPSQTFEKMSNIKAIKNIHVVLHNAFF